MSMSQLIVIVNQYDIVRSDGDASSVRITDLMRSALQRKQLHDSVGEESLVQSGSQGSQGDWARVTLHELLTLSSPLCG